MVIPILKACALERFILSWAMIKEKPRKSDSVMVTSLATSHEVQLIHNKLPRVMGLPVQVKSDEECEEADCVVCILASESTPFTDNLKGPCAKCGIELQFRPHVPKKPPKWCLACTLKEIEADRARAQN